MDWFAAAGVVPAQELENVREAWGGVSDGHLLVSEMIAFRNCFEHALQRIVAEEDLTISHDFIVLVNEWLLDFQSYEQLESVNEDENNNILVKNRVVLADKGPQQMKGWMAAISSDFLCRYDYNLIKKCENPQCILYFYDTSKNRKRRWCSMNLCGNRLKVAAHYKKNRKTT
jgi:predicted RNA-binding Zn ribbon-like protein